MNGIYQHYIIDLSSNNNFVQIPTVQGDGNNIRGFEVELIENGIPYIIKKEDCVVSIMGTKPDTCQIINECQITDDGYIKVDITSQISAVPGRGDYQIVLMSRSTNSQLKSFPFYVITTPAAFDIDYIISTDEFQLLTHNIVQVNTSIVNANKAVSDIRTLETSIENAETSRVNAEKNRVNAEKTRVNAEKGRVNAETTRSNAETIRQSNETTRQNNTTTAITNANNATDRANKAAEACEGIVDKSGVVMQTEKGNTVATLDENKKLTSSQLPIAKSNIFGAVKIGNNITNTNGTISISKENVTNALGFTPIKQTSTELLSSTEPAGQIVGDFWLQEY